DEPLDDALLLEDVVAEDRRAAAVVQQERRQEPDERRLARAVLPEDRDTFAALDREGNAFQCRHAPALAPQAGARRVAAEELLAQIVDFNGVHLLAPTRPSTGHERRAPPADRRAARARVEVSRRAASPSKTVPAV